MECPKCGSRFLRPSQTRTFREKLRALWFVMPVRCKDCKTRFVTDTTGFQYLSFARCPNCRRMDLNRWSGETFVPRGITWLKVSLGAARFRCEYCRLNFASFRKRKEVFSFKRWKRIELAHQAASGTGKPKVPRDNPDSDQTAH